MEGGGLFCVRGVGWGEGRGGGGCLFPLLYSFCLSFFFFSFFFFLFFFWVEEVGVFFSLLYSADLVRLILREGCAGSPG